MRRENGSVLFMILIAVALFAALSYVVAQMMRGGDSGNMVGAEKASLLSDEVIGYGGQLRQSVQGLRISNGCGVEDISFETAELTGYDHTPAATSNCMIFDPSGAGMTYIKPSPDVGDGSDWVFTGANIVEDVGTASPDLVAILPNLKLTVCNAINDKLGLPGFGSDAGVSFTKFQDTYASTETLDDAGGFVAGCLNYSNSGDNYFFYQVLISR